MTTETTEQLTKQPNKTAETSSQPNPSPWSSFKRKLGSFLNSRWWIGLSLFFVLLGALLLRLYELDFYPRVLLPDEADNLGVVYHIMAGTGPGILGLDWKPQPIFSMYLLTAGLKIFGNSIFGTRMPTAIFSTLALIPFYALVKRSLSAVAIQGKFLPERKESQNAMLTSEEELRKVKNVTSLNQGIHYIALATTFLLATNTWYLNFSRSGWENVHIVLYAMLTWYCLLRAFDHGPRRWVWYTLAGVGCALGLYGYFAGRLIILGVAAYFIPALWIYRQHWRTVVLGYVITFSVALALFAPQFKHIQDDPGLSQSFNRRTDDVSILRQKEYRGNTEQKDIIFYQLKQNALMFNSGEVNNAPRYSPVGKPILDLTTGLLFLLGILLSLRYQRSTLFWWAIFVPSWFGTQVMTTGTPDGARGIAMSAPVFFFAGLAMFYLWFQVRRLLSKGRLRFGRPIFAALVIIMVVGIGIFNVQHYFNWVNTDETTAAFYPYVERNDFNWWRDVQYDLAVRNKDAITVTDWYEFKARMNNEPSQTTYDKR